MPDPKAEVLDQNIAKLDHLNGVLYEAMRLYPGKSSNANLKNAGSVLLTTSSGSFRMAETDAAGGYHDWWYSHSR